MNDFEEMTLIFVLVSNMAIVAMLLYYSSDYSTYLKSLNDYQTQLKIIMENRFDKLDRKSETVAGTSNLMAPIPLEDYSKVKVDNSDILDELWRIEKEVKKIRKGEAK
ncbi:hypothetical protein [uncultured Dialister sp.]|uniref:hypothetical protein n=1 Tax=Dialister succinatiphilus TaxID=487173 RepID=UPI0026703B8D|nr:hypothetical protein [uncultured Dialister sp.]